MAEPQLIDGNLAVDDRGVLGFINGFNFKKVKRFYWVTNHRKNFVRAWHAHKHEAKYVTVIQGAALICAVKIDRWNNPSKDCPLWRYSLSEQKPALLYIPAGYANGFMSLTKDAKLVFFSTASLVESKNDDFRFEARYWDPWKIIER
jgi:dTDP-4-dehydrorhamnose 3,5-epimerase